MALTALAHFILFFRTSRVAREIIPLDKWELFPEQIEYEEELGRGAFGVVYKATLKRRVGIEVFDRSKRLEPKNQCKVVAVKVLQGIFPFFTSTLSPTCKIQACMSTTSANHFQYVEFTIFYTARNLVENGGRACVKTPLKGRNRAKEVWKVLRFFFRYSQLEYPKLQLGACSVVIRLSISY